MNKNTPPQTVISKVVASTSYVGFNGQFFWQMQRAHHGCWWQTRVGDTLIRIDDKHTLEEVERTGLDGLGVYVVKYRCEKDGVHRRQTIHLRLVYQGDPRSTHELEIHPDGIRFRPYGGPDL